MKFSRVLIFLLVCVTNFAYAEGGCPPGQYPIGGQGAIACAPMSQERTVQPPRPSGEWIKTWGAIATDSGDNLGVAKGKMNKADAELEAIAQCSTLSSKKCHIALVYRNQCASIAEPYRAERAVSGMLAFNGGPTKEIAIDDSLSNCKASNPDASCRVIYTACSEPVFRSY